MKKKKQCVAEKYSLAHTWHIFCLSVILGEPHALGGWWGGIQELQSAGGRQGCHGNKRVRSPGCCSASIGAHYATSHLSISVSLLSPVPPLFIFFIPVVTDGEGGGVFEEEAYDMLKLTHENKMIGPSACAKMLKKNV